jgi:hypothetical protein
MITTLLLATLLSAPSFACEEHAAAAKKKTNLLASTKMVKGALPESPGKAYGKGVTLASEPISLKEALQRQTELAGQDILVQAEVGQACQTKGCWMDLDMGNGQNLTVRFKDYGFFVPMDATGKKAVVSGYVKVDTLTVDWLKHKAQDAGKSQAHIDSITEPRVEYSFMANGVAIEADAKK